MAALRLLITVTLSSTGVISRMITLTLNEVSEILQGELVGASVPVSGLSIDTRTLVNGDIYLAIKGEQFDGHDFMNLAQFLLRWPPYDY
jgi:hypothetical protein